MLDCGRQVDFTIRPATLAEAEAAAGVLRRSIREVCGPDYSHDERLLSAWCANKTAENLAGWIADSDLFTIVAATEAGLVAVGQIHHSGAIRLCYAVPEAIGRGIGSAVLATLEAEARRLGLRRVTLISTTTAQRFYRRHGYHEIEPPIARGPGYSFRMAKDFDGERIR